MAEVTPRIATVRRLADLFERGQTFQVNDLLIGQHQFAQTAGWDDSDKRR